MSRPPRKGSRAIAAGGFDVVALDHHLADRHRARFPAALARPRAGAAGGLCHRLGGAVGRGRGAQGGRRGLRAKDGEASSSSCSAAPIEQAHRAGAAASARRSGPSRRCARRATAPSCCCARSTTASPTACRSSRSLVRLQACSTTIRGAQRASHETQARITAIAGVHRRLYTSATCGSVEIDDYLSGLLKDLEASMNSPATGR